MMNNKNLFMKTLMILKFQIYNLYNFILKKVINLCIVLYVEISKRFKYIQHYKVI